MHLRTALQLALALLAGVPATATAATFLSIDITTDELVRIDSATGTVSVVGPTGFNFTNAQLAVLGGSLYAINPPAGSPATVPFLQLDPVTGATLASTTVRIGATSITPSAADALTSDGSTLLIAYSASASFPFSSYALADLSPTGQLSNVTLFATSRDMDNIASRPGGPLYALDGVVVSPNNRNDLYAVARPSTYTLLGSHFVTTGNDGHTGLAFDAAGELWGWRRAARALDRISTANGALLQSIAIATTRSLRGLALSPDAPTPAAAASWGRLKALYR